MRTESNIRPNELEVFKLSHSSARITFCTNIQEVPVESPDGEPTVRYEYDSYDLIVPFSENIEQRIRSRFNEWLAKAQQLEVETLSQEARALRDKLLAESDSAMLLDRMSLDVSGGSSFTSWLKFLKGLVSALTGSWATYRKALRDLPEQEGFPYNIKWPEKPKS